MKGNLDAIGSRKPQTGRDQRDTTSAGPVPRSNPAVKAGDGKLPAPKPGPFDAKVTSPEIQKLIPIRGDGKSMAHSSGPVEPMKYWRDYYKTHEETGEQLRETLRILNAAGKSQDIFAALSGYLTSRPKNQETWMYEAAAVAAEMNGKPQDVKRYLGYAADLAQQSHNPNDLVSVADKLYLKGYYERIGPLLDEAAAKIPHRSEPLRMSINLAQKTKDPVRMRQAIQALLSLGWPGSDEFFRQESRKEAETLAKLLKEEGRAKEAEELLASLPDAESRDLFVRLSWSGDADYNLSVEEPLGATASLAMPRTVFGGALLNEGKLSHPEEVYVCPRGFDGEYQIRVEEIYSDPKNPTTRLSLEVITNEGTPQERKQVFPLNPGQLSKPIAVTLVGGRRKTVMPFVNPLAAFAPALEAQEKKRAKLAKQNPPARVQNGKDEFPKTARDPIKVER